MKLYIFVIFTIVDLVRCPVLPTPVNGYKTSLLRDSKDVMFFSCDENSTLIGSEIRICQDNATWTGTQAYCEYCDNLSYFKNVLASALRETATCSTSGLS